MSTIHLYLQLNLLFILFKGTGNLNDIGIGKGQYYTVNVPLHDGIRDAEFTPLVCRYVNWIFCCETCRIYLPCLGLWNLFAIQHYVIKFVIVTCNKSVVFSRYSCLPTKQATKYIVESGVKQHNPTLTLKFGIIWQGMSSISKLVCAKYKKNYILRPGIYIMISCIIKFVKNE